MPHRALEALPILRDLARYFKRGVYGDSAVMQLNYQVVDYIFFWRESVIEIFFKVTSYLLLAAFILITSEKILSTPIVCTEDISDFHRYFCLLHGTSLVNPSFRGKP